MVAEVEEKAAENSIGVPHIRRLLNWVWGLQIIHLIDFSYSWLYVFLSVPKLFEALTLSL
jgi:hypothetical protein